ncbi:MAG: signal peptidase I [Chloroflexota bacterium]
MKGIVRETLITVVLAVIIFLAAQVTIQSSIVVGSSMYPTLEPDQRLIINKLAYRFNEPQRGDIIVFHRRQSEKVEYIKRIIGLPGESVEIKEGRVYIHRDGEALPLEEPYIKEASPQHFTGDIIPENEYFFLGDNRNNSNDSRRDWLAHREDIVGKAWILIWPPDTWGLAPHYSTP